MIVIEILENVNPDLSDSEFIEQNEPIDAPTPALGSDLGDASTPMADFGDGEEEDDDDDEGEGDIDEDLAAELDLALEEGDEEDDEDESEDDEEDDDDDDEDVQSRKLLNEEIRDLEAAVAKKENEIASSVNPLIKVRCLVPLYFRRPLTGYVLVPETVRRRAEKTYSRFRYEASPKRRDERATAIEEGRHCFGRWG
jgi:hypothetical protein